jgi:tRNA(adenine34) deaminase
VGACASTPGGEIIYSARNRVNYGEGPPGEIFGSALAHAETNVLARLPFRSRRDLILTTTLQPCLQCAGAIRLGPIATVRFAGPDRYWDGCHDFGRLSAREARRTQPARIGPRRDELGKFFGVFMSVNPVFAALTGLIVLGQSLEPADWLAVAAIVTANAVSVSAAGRHGPGQVFGVET